MYHYRDLLRNNVFNIALIALYILFLSLISYSIFGPYNVLDITSNCGYGFFYITKFLFKENSHFALVAGPILIFFTFYFNKLLKKKITLLIFGIFLIFCLLNNSLTIFLIIFFGSLGLIIVINKNYLSKVYLVLLMIITTMFFINQTNICDLEYKFSYKKEYQSFDEKNFELSNYDINHNVTEQYDIFTGKIRVQTGKTKLSQLYKTTNFNNDYNDNYLLNIFLDEENNLSVRLFFSSLNIAYRSLKKYPFGVGLDNYNHAFEVISGERKRELYADSKLYFKKRDFCEIYYCCLDCLDSFNKNDGTINFSKSLTEFGIISLIFFFITFYRSFSDHIDLNIKILYYPMIFSQLFIRGSGYFYNGFFIVMILVIIAIYMKSNENKR